MKLQLTGDQWNLVPWSNKLNKEDGATILNNALHVIFNNRLFYNERMYIPHNRCPAREYMWRTMKQAEVYGATESVVWDVFEDLMKKRFAKTK